MTYLEQTRTRNGVAVMSCEEFGDILLSTGDLDPVYIMLAQAKMPETQLKRWLLGYWSFYHVGVASRLAEARSPAEYWDLMRVAYDKKWPRGAERRYFRGPKVLRTLEWFQNFGSPEFLVDRWTNGIEFGQIKRQVCCAPLFGDWISFKIADMTERVLRRPVGFTDCHLDIYKDPRQGAALLIKGNYEEAVTGGELAGVISDIVEHFAGYVAPPHGDRPINIQEAETILCKYKSHYKGSYPIGKDTREVGHALVGWGDLAGQLRYYLPVQKGASK